MNLSIVALLPFRCCLIILLILCNTIVAAKENNSREASSKPVKVFSASLEGSTETTTGEENVPLRRKSFTNVGESTSMSASSPSALEAAVNRRISVIPMASMVEETTSFDFLRHTSWLRKGFEIKCCRGGVPRINQPELVRNFTYHVEYVTDEADSLGELVLGGQSSSALDVGDVTAKSSAENAAAFDAAAALNCRVFTGEYYTAPNIEMTFEIRVLCKCPDIGAGHMLDRNCRHLPNCKNNGFRSSIHPQKCLCLQPFFGDKCEKFCDHGQRIRGLNGRDYCSCAPFYKGEECHEVICLNGGVEENGRCNCLPQFLGYHCEIDINRTTHHHHEFASTINVNTAAGSGGGGTRFQRFGDQVSNEMFTRDISGTIFSLIMIVVLVVSMYLLMKHRMQTRFLSSRRPDLLGACNFPIGAMAPPPGSGGGVPSTARRIELMPTIDVDGRQARTFPYRMAGVGAMSLPPLPIADDGGPPPYISSTHRGRRHGDDLLPPLPSYEDATKLPPLRQGGVDAADDGNYESIVEDNAIEMVPRIRALRQVEEDGALSVGSSVSTPSTSDHCTPSSSPRNHLRTDPATNPCVHRESTQIQPQNAGTNSSQNEDVSHQFTSSHNNSPGSPTRKLLDEHHESIDGPCSSNNPNTFAQYSSECTPKNEKNEKI